ncbi:hypothetical protein [Demequina sp. NBRC 110055]|uniref:hypothetical protein n=1 Tax=Demequina sp. NBRC 110055 TaxID=1570344 RepID=UPI001186272C|nr:hypothetical protein [Demequina sp. NBRC 110055]
MSWWQTMPDGLWALFGVGVTVTATGMIERSRRKSEREQRAIEEKALADSRARDLAKRRAELLREATIDYLKRFSDLHSFSAKLQASAHTDEGETPETVALALELYDAYKALSESGAGLRMAATPEINKAVTKHLDDIGTRTEAILGRSRSDVTPKIVRDGMDELSLKCSAQIQAFEEGAELPKVGTPEPVSPSHDGDAVTGRE